MKTYTIQQSNIAAIIYVTVDGYKHDYIYMSVGAPFDTVMNQYESAGSVCAIVTVCEAPVSAASAATAPLSRINFDGKPATSE